jgi:hypothetical protein
MFHGIEFRCVGRERNESHIPGNCEESCGMPSCTVKDHNDPVFRVPGCNFVEKYLHAVTVHMRQNEAVKFSVDNRHRAIGIGVFLRHHGLTERAMRLRDQHRLVSEMRPKRASSSNITLNGPFPGHSSVMRAMSSGNFFSTLLELLCRLLGVVYPEQASSNHDGGGGCTRTPMQWLDPIVHRVPVLSR